MRERLPYDGAETVCLNCSSKLVAGETLRGLRLRPRVLVWKFVLLHQERLKEAGVRDECPRVVLGEN